MDKLTEEQRQKIMGIHKERNIQINIIMNRSKIIDGIIPISHIELMNALKKLEYEYTCSMNLVLGIPPP